MIGMNDVSDVMINNQYWVLIMYAVVCSLLLMPFHALALRVSCMLKEACGIHVVNILPRIWAFSADWRTGS